MTTDGPDGFDSTMEQIIRGARRIAVVGVGDDLSPLDRLGMVAAREIEREHLPGVRVFLADTMPENVTGPVRRFRPDLVLFLDAAEIGERPGTIAVVRPGEVEARLFSVHAMPLPVVMEFIARGSPTRVILLGIQPATTGWDADLSSEDRAHLHQNLTRLSKVLRTAVGNAFP